MAAAYDYVQYGHEATTYKDSVLLACKAALDDAESSFCAFVAIRGEGYCLKNMTKVREYIEEHNTAALLRKAYVTEDQLLRNRYLEEIAGNLGIDLKGEEE